MEVGLVALLDVPEIKKVGNNGLDLLNIGEQLNI